MSSVRPHVAALALMALAACGGSAPPPAQTVAAQPPPSSSVPSSSVPSSPSWPSDLLPLPQVPFAPARPMPVVQEVYRFAAEHPEVLSRIPCFCGCENRGHKDNDDCFVAGRDAKGRVTEWEPHGMGWSVCLDVAREAMQMNAAGAPLKSIRAAIEAKYRPHFDSMTPTPPIDR